MKTFSVSTEIQGKKIELKIGEFAKQANGSVMAQMGETVVMATAVMSSEIREGIDYFPLSCEYEEKMYAAGKIVGSRFIKREGRPSDNAILTGRMIDRSLRPLFSSDMRNDVQVIITVLSIDNENDPDILSMIAASAALTISGIPFHGPVSSFRVSKIKDRLVVNPTEKERAENEFESVISITDGRVTMLETDGFEASEDDIKKAFDIAAKEAKAVDKIQKDLAAKVNKAEIEVFKNKENEDLLQKIEELVTPKLEKAIYTKDDEIAESLAELRKEVSESFEEEEKKEAQDVFDKIVKKTIRENILKNDKRPDLRKLDEVRKIDIEIGVLPRTHGSIIFRRGMTEGLTITTIGSTSDAQILDTMEEDTTKRYMHHYNFPPYSCGEARPLRGAGRREIGHGALAEKALVKVMPAKDDFPYTVRLVTEILSSNGSTSMAATCGSTLSLMDAGVPIKSPVAGISIGLVTSEDEKKHKIVTDLIALEDFTGDMDFKVAGTKKGVTAIQMDTKLRGVPIEFLKEGLDAAKKARLDILKIMQAAISEPRKELSKYAPRISKITIDTEKIKDVIGPGGKVINQIIDETGVEIDIEDDGTVMVFSPDQEANKKAIEKIENIVKEIEPGEVYDATVTRVLNFGAMVELLPGKEGLVHISKISKEFVKDIHKIVKVGDKMKVVVTEIDSGGRTNLARKDL